MGDLESILGGVGARHTNDRREWIIAEQAPSHIGCTIEHAWKVHAPILAPPGGVVRADDVALHMGNESRDARGQLGVFAFERIFDEPGESASIDSDKAPVEAEPLAGKAVGDDRAMVLGPLP